MPIYIFESVSENDKYIELFFDFQVAPKIGEVIIDSGKKYKRIPTIPNSIIKDKINPDSQTDFIQKTEKTKGKMGDLFDRSKELSEAREKKYGFDPIKEKYFDNWSKKRNGKKHIDDPRPSKLVKEKNSKKNVSK